MRISDWSSDVCSSDLLKDRRLDRPYVRKNGKLEAASWTEAFAAIAGALKGVAGSQIAAIAGDMACGESVLALKDLMEKLGSPNLDCRQDGAMIDPANRAGYLFNAGIAGIDEADEIGRAHV